MSSTATPFGLKAVQQAGGGVVRIRARTLTSGYATNLYENTPITISSAGVVTAAATGGPATGTFVSIEYNDTTLGKYQVQNFWPASTVATNIVVYVTEDPMIEYEIQANGSLTTANIGEQATFTGTSGTTTSHISTAALDTATLSTSANVLFRIVDIPVYPDNVSGDAFTIARVQIANHAFVATRVAF